LVSDPEGGHLTASTPSLLVWYVRKPGEGQFRVEMPSSRST
jgi:hypothetical protein